eukprot:TRINITY_DN4700_c0_g1_i2.p1 TRINITY_DN4700_c0_g1~~TRINITY_DN4700_c0_g1_i2.p1  ORF type:complete len:1008 (+),score=259.82 TRINITY_DN4700_c0_g1_i2:193-3216(+)
MEKLLTLPGATPAKNRLSWSGWAPEGARVKVNSSGQELAGTVRFNGTTSFASGDWTGIELDTPDGKNDGSMKGTRYFTCPPAHGLFVRPMNIICILEDPREKEDGDSQSESEEPHTVRSADADDLRRKSWSPVATVSVHKSLEEAAQASRTISGRIRQRMSFSASSWPTSTRSSICRHSEDCSPTITGTVAEALRREAELRATNQDLESRLKQSVSEVEELAAKMRRAKAFVVAEAESVVSAAIEEANEEKDAAEKAYREEVRRAKDEQTAQGDELSSARRGSVWAEGEMSTLQLQLKMERVELAAAQDREEMWKSRNASADLECKTVARRCDQEMDSMGAELVSERQRHTEIHEATRSVRTEMQRHIVKLLWHTRGPRKLLDGTFSAWIQGVMITKLETREETLRSETADRQAASVSQRQEDLSDSDALRKELQQLQENFAASQGREAEAAESLRTELLTEKARHASTVADGQRQLRAVAAKMLFRLRGPQRVLTVVFEAWSQAGALLRLEVGDQAAANAEEIAAQLQSEHEAITQQEHEVAESHIQTTLETNALLLEMEMREVDSEERVVKAAADAQGAEELVAALRQELSELEESKSASLAQAHRHREAFQSLQEEHKRQRSEIVNLRQEMLDQRAVWAQCNAPTSLAATPLDCIKSVFKPPKRDGGKQKMPLTALRSAKVASEEEEEDELALIEEVEMLAMTAEVEAFEAQLQMQERMQEQVHVHGGGSEQLEELRAFEMKLQRLEKQYADEHDMLIQVEGEAMEEAEALRDAYSEMDSMGCRLRMEKMKGKRRESAMQLETSNQFKVKRFDFVAPSAIKEEENEEGWGWLSALTCTNRTHAHKDMATAHRDALASGSAPTMPGPTLGPREPSSSSIGPLSPAGSDDGRRKSARPPPPPRRAASPGTIDSHVRYSIARHSVLDPGGLFGSLDVGPHAAGAARRLTARPPAQLSPGDTPPDSPTGSPGGANAASIAAQRQLRLLEQSKRRSEAVFPASFKVNDQ